MNVLVWFISLVACVVARTWPEFPVIDPIPEASVPSIQQRIINGTSATVHQFPWFVSIRSQAQNGLQSICGGSLISPEWVLTAAHCTHNYVSYNLGFGSNNLNAPLRSMTSKEAIEHLRYNPETLNYDISVIKLPEYMAFTAQIQSVRLPTLNQARQGQFHTTKARVCGYGRTGDGTQTLSTDLNWVDKRIISNDQCSRSYGPTVVLPSTLCTLGWENNSQSTCNGDSGGPLLIDEGGLWTQIGIVSFVSNQGCASGHPAGYIRTTSFLNWISINTGIAIRP